MVIIMGRLHIHETTSRRLSQGMTTNQASALAANLGSMSGRLRGYLNNNILNSASQKALAAAMLDNQGEVYFIDRLGKGSDSNEFILAVYPPKNSEDQTVKFCKLSYDSGDTDFSKKDQITIKRCSEREIDNDARESINQLSTALGHTLSLSLEPQPPSEPASPSPIRSSQPPSPTSSSSKSTRRQTVEGTSWDEVVIIDDRQFRTHTKNAETKKALERLTAIQTQHAKLSREFPAGKNQTWYDNTLDQLRNVKESLLPFNRSDLNDDDKNLIQQAHAEFGLGMEAFIEEANKVVQREQIAATISQLASEAEKIALELEGYAWKGECQLLRLNINDTQTFAREYDENAVKALQQNANNARTIATDFRGQANYFSKDAKLSVINPDTQQPMSSSAKREVDRMIKMRNLQAQTMANILKNPSRTESASKDAKLSVNNLETQQPTRSSATREVDRMIKREEPQMSIAASTQRPQLSPMPVAQGATDLSKNAISEAMDKTIFDYKSRVGTDDDKYKALVNAKDAYISKSTPENLRTFLVEAGRGRSRYISKDGDTKSFNVFNDSLKNPAARALVAAALDILSEKSTESIKTQLKGMVKKSIEEKKMSEPTISASAKF